MKNNYESLFNKLRVGYLVRITTKIPFYVDDYEEDYVATGYVKCVKRGNIMREHVKISPVKIAWHPFAFKVFLKDIERIEVLK